MAEHSGKLAVVGDGFASLSTNAANATGNKPVPMKLFSTWEVEKSTPSCIPRLCSVTLTRLVVRTSLESELQSIVIAIKMQSSKRILRSNEINVPRNGLLDTELDLSFALQYPHFLKRDGNRLQVMLQRRKKYKNRAMLGYKTLAAGYINMSQVLQHPVDHEMHLYAYTKDSHSTVVAQVMMISLCSQPVDNDDRQQALREMSDDDDIRDDPEFSSNDDASDVDPGQCDDDRPRHSRTKSHSIGNTFTARQRNLKQKFVFLLRRFKVTDDVLVSAVEGLGEHGSNPRYVEDIFEDVENLSDSDPDIDTISIHSTPKPKLKPFFTGKEGNYIMESLKSHVMENDKLSDDNNSRKTDSDNSQTVCSTQEKKKHAMRNRAAVLSNAPKEKRFNTKSKKLIKCRRFVHKKGATQQEKSSLKDFLAADVDCVAGDIDGAPQRILLDQLSTILSSDMALPECLLLMSAQENHNLLLVQMLQSAKNQMICTTSTADVKAVISAVINKIQKFASKNTTASLPLKLAIIGSDSYISSVVRPYVELFSSKSSDWLNYIRFFIVPFVLGSSIIAKNLALLDSKYNSIFNDSTWKDNIIDKCDTSNRFSQSMDLSEVASRILRYITDASHLVQLPLAEVIITNKDKGSDDSSQLIVPFIGEVRLGPIDVANPSIISSTGIDADDMATSPVGLSSSPPQSSHMINGRNKDSTLHGPGNAQPANTPSHSPILLASESGAPTSSAIDLQVDYWMIPPRNESQEKGDRSVKKELKCSLKTMFRSMQVFRPLATPAGVVGQSHMGDRPLQLANVATGQYHTGDNNSSASGLTMIVVTKEKKQKIMRLGKKTKELDVAKSQQIDSVSRLICTSKSQNHLLSVTIDGTDWPAVKFFQVSAQWQTHVKHFPVLVFGSDQLS